LCPNNYKTSKVRLVNQVTRQASKLDKLNKLKTQKPEITRNYYCLIFQAALKGGIPSPGVALILKLPPEGQLANFASLRVALNLRH